jgi:DMSO/TMAO reductase YedYZ molybdopterin-dependent catalytic subunit
MTTPPIKDMVVQSVNNEFADRCVDIILRADGSFGFKEFRRDAEDLGAWSLTGYDERGVYASAEAALDAALERVPWLRDALTRADQAATRASSRQR